jgi:hypothetical protein
MSYLDKKRISHNRIRSSILYIVLYLFPFYPVSHPLSFSFFLQYSIQSYSHRTLEKKYQDQVRCLEEDLIRERESMAAKWMQLKNDFERDKATLVNHEIELRRQLEHMEKVL